MSETIKGHLAYTIGYGMLLGLAGLCLLTGRLGYALLFFAHALTVLGCRFRQRRKGHQVKGVRSAQKATRKSAFSVTGKGGEALRLHLREHPDDFQVAVTLARSLSKFTPEPEGQQVYELACRGALKCDMRQAVEIFKEYWARYLKPFEHHLTLELSLVAEQYGDAHFATQGLEAVFNAAEVEPVVARRALNECIRICVALGLTDAAATYRERLKALPVA